MTRLAITVAIAFSALAAAPARAGDLRTVDGERVDMDSPALLVFWSLEDGEIGLRHAAHLADSGARVVAVNTDDASRKSEVRAFAVVRAPQVDVVNDAGARLQRQVRASDNDAVVIGTDGAVVWRTNQLERNTAQALTIASMHGATAAVAGR